MAAAAAEAGAALAAEAPSAVAAVEAAAVSPAAVPGADAGKKKKITAQTEP